MRRPFKILLLLFVAAVIFYLYCFIAVSGYANVSHSSNADVAIVLGASSSSGVVSPVFRERLNHGIHLQKSGAVNYLFITGGKGEGEEISDSQAGKEYAVSQGVDPAKIFIEEISVITYGNLCYSKQLMDSLGLGTAIIISDPYHMRRAMKMTAKLDISAQSSPTPTSMYRSTKTKRRFLINQAGQYWFYLLVHQFVAKCPQND